MAKVINHEPLFSTDLKYFKALQIIDGRTVFDRYNSLANIVKNNIDAQYQDFISYPIKEGNEIEFHGKIPKEEPRVLSGLQENDLTKYQNLKTETLAYYNNKIEELKNTGKTDEAEFLSKAVKYADDRFVYCYDDKVVLGAWGMTLKENLRADISEIRKNLVTKKKPEPQPEAAQEIPPINPFTVRFDEGDNGNLNGQAEYSKYEGDFVTETEIPQVEPKDGYEFTGWDEEPSNYSISGDKVFTAQYREIPVVPPIPPKKLPWWKRFWTWLTTLFSGRGCLKWLLWLLLILLLLWLFSWLVRGCDGGMINGGGGALDDNDSTWLENDPRVGDERGIYDPYNPYTPVPTPPDYEDVLPPQQGTLPPIGDKPEIIPGNPIILGNRLNILMENDDKSIMDLAKDFKTKYPEDKYKVVYYDDVVKRMQIEIPTNERENLKEVIPDQFAPKYQLFVFDEALFEGVIVPNNNSDKDWYLSAINAEEAWGITQGSEKITVAIVDNGFNLQHPELSSKVVQPYNVWKRSREIFPQPIDHGTHVAGTALAIASDGKGITGIAPNCKFMPIQVADEQGRMTTTSVLDGILYALYQGADVINVSLGSQFNELSHLPETEQKELISKRFKEEERLWREIMRIAANHNATLVVAAGNDNVLAGIDALQRPELFIVVSATDRNNQNLTKARFSNYGQYSTISAPGVGIYSSVGRNSYETMDGTSMAAPMVSGAVALMKSLNPSLTTKNIICILQETGLKTQENIGSLIQIDKALRMVNDRSFVDCTPEPSTGDVQILLSWNNYNDLDLICTDPSGDFIYYKNRFVSSGGQLEIDMNVEYPDSRTPIENIYWKPGTAPNGTYSVYLSYYKKHENSIDETAYQIQVKYGEKTEVFKGMIKESEKAIPIFTFTLGNAENPSTNSKRIELERERNQLQMELDRVNNELRNIRNSN